MDKVIDKFLLKGAVNQFLMHKDLVSSTQSSWSKGTGEVETKHQLEAFELVLM